MNTYYKYAPNVFIAKCTEKHEKGDIIPVTTKYGKDNDSIVFNLIGQKDGFYYYSIIRADGLNIQNYAKRKIERLEDATLKEEAKSTEYWKKSNDHVSGIVPGQPILVGHHSEKRHRRDLEKSWNAMDKSVEASNKAEELRQKAQYWEKKTNEINLSMPESLEYYEFKLEEAIEKYKAIKEGRIERRHSFDLQYANKEVKELQKKLELAKKLWS